MWEVGGCKAILLKYNIKNQKEKKKKITAFTKNVPDMTINTIKMEGGGGGGGGSV